jgi:hypothetical protein
MMMMMNKPAREYGERGESRDPKAGVESATVHVINAAQIFMSEEIHRLFIIVEVT